MKSRHNLRFSLRHIKGRPVCLGNTADQVNQKQGKQRQEKPLVNSAGLHKDDLPQIQRTGCHQYTYQCESHRDLVGNNLGS